MKKFYLGMDIGTESVGMACTDEEYNLLRAKGKDLWAVRLFDEASDASARRMQRTARRRLQRRRQRIGFLQGIFAPFMADNNFFLRLNNSGFCEEDKAEGLFSRYALFSDNRFTDAEFHQAYPTIYHLRKALIDGQSADLRLFYLALHHIIKYRGHFLFEGEDVNAGRDLDTLLQHLNYATEEAELPVWLSADKAEPFRKIALSDTGVTQKKKDAKTLFNATDKPTQAMLDLLVGASIKIGAIFDEEDPRHEKYGKMKLSFKETTDESFAQLSSDCDEEDFAVLETAREIYNFFVFERVLNGKKYISESMIAIYDKHHADLRRLKNFVKQNYPQETYYQLFRSVKEKANYVAYIGYTKTKGNKHKVKHCKPEEFFKYLKSVLKNGKVEDATTRDEILAEIDNGTFLNKILHADNGLFPHQINGAELNAILDNLCKQYPQFCSKDDDGYTPAEKIKKIFLHKIPYYVGPLNPLSQNSWFVRKAEGKITPWNFDEMIDKTASNEQFIRRMTNKCSYLRSQDVLPKGSMYYQAFDTLNQLNKITINSEAISVELKQDIFHNVFLKYKKVGTKQITDYLVQSGKFSKEDGKKITYGGFETATGIKANMGSYVLFKGKFGDLVDTNPEIFEWVILCHTLNTDKNLAEEMILRKYGDVAAIRDNIKYLKGLTAFKEFGNLSKQLLCELVGGADPNTGEIYTILRQLYHTNDNFNQLLYNEQYAFLTAIEEANCGIDNETVDYDSVKELYVSPMVRRGIWQSLLMADEYVRAVGRAPDKIFIEFTREDSEKVRTKTRKQKLQEFYKGITEDRAAIDALLQELNREEISESRLRQERLYLYFLQLGRCAYTGEPIDLATLSSNVYDVDHIVPQSLYKDDSLDNKVLVKREKNAQKTDIYPLPQGFTNQQSFWKLLREKGLMSEKKYAALIRTKPLDGDDFREFVNRQLVVTNQTVKAVAELLKRKYGPLGTKIVYSKARNVNDFKTTYNIVKCRETNDLHHARDAYLNIVVGNVFDTKFTNAFAYYHQNSDNAFQNFSTKVLFKYPVSNAWAGAQTDLPRIKAIAQKTSMQVTRYPLTGKGAFYDETIYSKDDDGVAVPRKGRAPYQQTEKYGGYKSLKTAYFAVVTSKDKKGNPIKTLEAIPVLWEYQTHGDTTQLTERLKTRGLVDPVIQVQHIRAKTLLSVNGYRVWIAGVTGNQFVLHNAQQWYTDEKTDEYMKQLIKLLERDRKGFVAEQEKQGERIALIANSNGVSLWATKEENLALYTQIVDTLHKKTYQGLQSVKSFAQKLQDKQEKFTTLTVFEQLKVLAQLARFMKCNAELADLTLLDDGANCGLIRIGKNITDMDIRIIHQSPCGLIERVQKL